MTILLWPTVGEQIAEQTLEVLADAALLMFNGTLIALSAMWLNVGSNLEPGLQALGRVRGGGTFQSLLAGIAALCLILAAGKLAWERRAESARRILSGLLALAVVSAGAAVAIPQATAMTDQLAQAWLAESIRDIAAGSALAPGQGGDDATLEHTMTSRFSADRLKATPLLAIMMAGTGSLVGCLQIILLFLRTTLLMLLSVVFPLAAAASTTETGRAWFQKLVSWMIAFLLYKPVAALIYVTAFALVDTPITKPNDLVTVLYGVTMMVLSLLALPALLRLCTPLVAAVAGAGAMAALPGGSPSGAQPVSQPQGSQLGGGTSGPAGPSGAPASPASMTSAAGASGATGGASGGAAMSGGAAAGGGAAGAGAGATGAGAGAAGAGAGAGGAAAGAAGGPVTIGVMAAVGAARMASKVAGDAVDTHNQAGPDGSR